jgi:hypothetical protein
MSFEQPGQYSQNYSQQNPNYIPPSQVTDLSQTMASLTKLLLEVSNTLIALRRELRGDSLYQSEEGTTNWVQVSKPVFIKINQLTGNPYRKKTKMPWGEIKYTYIPNDEAIEEVLSMLKFAGVNQITSIAGIDFDNYMDDLREFECKLAAVLALKQKEWGLDKELLPMIQFKIKTLVQDARSMAVEGRVLKSLQTSVQRVEQMIQDDRVKKGIPNLYG